jgi:hypothetical protein
MRSTRGDLADVVAKFASWRTKRKGRAIPEELWDAAIQLLDGHTATGICRALGLNGTRFKQVREGRGVRVGRRVARRRAIAAGPAGNGFIELAPPRVATLGGLMHGSELPHIGSGCRVTVESAAGTLHVTTAVPGPALVEALCRLVLGALGDHARR